MTATAGEPPGTMRPFADPARVGERGHEQEYLPLAPTNAHQPLAEVDLQAACLAASRSAPSHAPRPGAPGDRARVRAFFSEMSSWHTTSALPRCHRSRSRSKSSSPSKHIAIWLLERLPPAWLRGSASRCHYRRRACVRSASCPSPTPSATASPLPPPARHCLPQRLFQPQRGRPEPAAILLSNHQKPLSSSTPRGVSSPWRQGQFSMSPDRITGGGLLLACSLPEAMALFGWVWEDLVGCVHGGSLGFQGVRTRVSQRV